MYSSTNASGDWLDEDTASGHTSLTSRNYRWKCTLTINNIFVGTYDETNDKQSVTITLGSSFRC